MTEGTLAAVVDPAFQVDSTPMHSIAFRIDGSWRRVHLKLEAYNPGGSSKDRTARWLMADLAARDLLKPSSKIIESTSGNLGVSLAYICRGLGYPFIAVVDPKTTSEIRSRMREFGAQLETVDEPDSSGGYLLSRLDRVRALCAQSEDYLWTNQYSNPANPEAHYRSTAPEIFSQIREPIDAIFVAVSTGGTFAGINRYVRERKLRTVVVAVDAMGSVAFGGKPGTRLLTGIGSSQRSNFLDRDRSCLLAKVGDGNAFSVCRYLDREIGLQLGGSSGAAIFACAVMLAKHRNLTSVVCVCPDGGRNYESTIFSDQWLLANNIDPTHRVSLVQAIKRLT